MVLSNRLMVGIGIGSVVMNFLRIIFLSTVPDLDTGAIVFFSLASGYLLFCAILSIIFLRGYNKYMLAKKQDDDSFIVNITDHKSRNENSFIETQKKYQNSLYYRTIKVYKIIYPYALSVAFTYAIQFSFFPGVILSHKLNFVKDFSWFAIGMITMQNLLDTVGRTFAGIKVLQVNSILFFIICFAR